MHQSKEEKINTFVAEPEKRAQIAKTMENVRNRIRDFQPQDPNER